MPCTWFVVFALRRSNQWSKSSTSHVFCDANLQEYNVSKRVEHRFKSLVHDGRTISAVSPVAYSRRFQVGMDNACRRASRACADNGFLVSLCIGLWRILHKPECSHHCILQISWLDHSQHLFLFLLALLWAQLRYYAPPLQAFLLNIFRPKPVKAAAAVLALAAGTGKKAQEKKQGQEQRQAPEGEQPQQTPRMQTAEPPEHGAQD